MSSIKLSRGDKRAVITIHGAFVFDLNRQFRDAYQSLPENTPVTVDLSNADYMDSAGLGMLIRLRKHAGDTNGAVTLKGANPTVKQILDVANFGHMFTMA